MPYFFKNVLAFALFLVHYWLLVKVTERYCAIIWYVWFVLGIINVIFNSRIYRMLIMIQTLITNDCRFTLFFTRNPIFDVFFHCIQILCIVQDIIMIISNWYIYWHEIYFWWDAIEVFSRIIGIIIKMYLVYKWCIDTKLAHYMLLLNIYLQI